MKALTLAAACLMLAFGTARADVYLTLSNAQWGTVNVTTGVFTPLGFSPVQMGDVAIDPTDKQAYGIGFDSNLYRIDRATGSGTIVGSSVYTNNLGVSVGGTLYETNGSLLSINKGTGQVANLGAFSTATIYDLALTANDDVFATDSNNLYKRALGGSGLANLLGNTGFSQVYGLAFEDHVLYGFGTNNGTPVVFSINETTGQGTFVAQLTGGGFDSGAFTFGAASSLPLGPSPGVPTPPVVSTPTSVPEPASLILFGTAGFLVAGYGARRRNKLHNGGNSDYISRTRSAASWGVFPMN